jgi:uncharacterized membrane protein HdeD (DUF308 family)
VIRSIVGSSRHLAVRGIAALLFGIATLAWPGITLWALVVLWGAYALADGTLALAAAIGDPLLRHRGWIALWGVSGIVAGIVTFFWPSITALALLVVIATWSFVVGVSLIAIALTERRHRSGEWIVGLTGVLSVLLGVVLVVRPGEGALALTWAIGWWACLSGGLALWLAWSVHREVGELPARPRRHTSTHAMS